MSYSEVRGDQAVVCSLVWRWRGEVEIDKVEPGRGKLSPFVTEFSSKAYLFRAKVQSSKYARRNPYRTIRPGGRSVLGKLSYNYICMSYSEVKESSLMRCPTYLWMIRKCQERNWLTET